LSGSNRPTSAVSGKLRIVSPLKRHGVCDTKIILWADYVIGSFIENTPRQVYQTFVWRGKIAEIETSEICANKIRQRSVVFRMLFISERVLQQIDTAKEITESLQYISLVGQQSYNNRINRFIYLIHPNKQDTIKEFIRCCHNPIFICIMYRESSINNLQTNAERFSEMRVLYASTHEQWYLCV